MQMISDASECSRNPIQSESNPIREYETGKNVRAATPPVTQDIPPIFETVSSYCLERGGLVNSQGFMDFYASKGWMVGNRKMVDWKAACRRAEKWDKRQSRTDQTASHR